jgi:hypothetical protein
VKSNMNREKQAKLVFVVVQPDFGTHN